MKGRKPNQLVCSQYLGPSPLQQACPKHLEERQLFTLAAHYLQNSKLIIKVTCTGSIPCHECNCSRTCERHHYTPPPQTPLVMKDQYCLPWRVRSWDCCSSRHGQCTPRAVGSPSQPLSGAPWVSRSTTMVPNVILWDYIYIHTYHR